MQVRRHNSLNFLWCSTFILFFDFSQYKSLNFLCSFGMLYAEKVEKHIKVAIFISKISWVQRRWKKTLKLPFFTPKSLHFYLIFMSK
ncbi:hypothetical protein D0Y65_035655, partial [Glycine soja]